MKITKSHLVVLSGAGVSAESGLKTFRCSDGLWENYSVEEVCTPEALHCNPELVLRFYNERRQQAKQAQPNTGHLALAELEKNFDVSIITQNVDNLHERAGSTKVLHLHGELTKVRSSNNPNLIFEIGKDIYKENIEVGDLAPDGSQLRPHIVFFGENVPNLEPATQIVATADILLIAGTSMTVYPAAYLYSYAPPQCPIYIINPAENNISINRKFIYIQKKFTEGMMVLIEKILTKQSI